jgi:hypothetical protein
MKIASTPSQIVHHKLQRARADLKHAQGAGYTGYGTRDDLASFSETVELGVVDALERARKAIAAAPARIALPIVDAMIADARKRYELSKGAGYTDYGTRDSRAEAGETGDWAALAVLQELRSAIKTRT